jgi:hypothetical protein
MSLLKFKLDNREFILNYWEEEKIYFRPKDKQHFCSGLDSRWDSGTSYAAGKTMGNLCSIRKGDKYHIKFFHDLSFLNEMFLNKLNNKFETLKAAQDQSLYILKRYLKLQTFI